MKTSNSSHRTLISLVIPPERTPLKSESLTGGIPHTLFGKSHPCPEDDWIGKRSVFFLLMHVIYNCGGILLRLKFAPV